MGNSCNKQALYNQQLSGSINPIVVIQHKLDKCQININLGSIFNEKVDAIVLITNKKLKPSQLTLEKLQKHAGLLIQQEIKNLLMERQGRLNFGQVVYSHAGDMDLDYIFYAILPSFSDSIIEVIKTEKSDSKIFQPSLSLIENVEEQQTVFQVYNDQHGNSNLKHEKQHIFECVYDTLVMADNLGLKSIAFPVMQPHTSLISISSISTITLVAIKTFLKDNKSLTNIHITTEDTQSMHLFKWSFQKFIIEKNCDINLEIKNEQKKTIDSNNYDNDFQELRTSQYLRFGHNYQKNNSEDQNRKSSI